MWTFHIGNYFQISNVLEWFFYSVQNYAVKPLLRALNFNKWLKSKQRFPILCFSSQFLIPSLKTTREPFQKKSLSQVLLWPSLRLSFRWNKVSKMQHVFLNHPQSLQLPESSSWSTKTSKVREANKPPLSSSASLPPGPSVTLVTVTPSSVAAQS